MTEQPEPLGVGLHYGVKAARYHGDPCPIPSLSSGIARTLLTQSPAAAFREHARLGGKRRETTEAMNTGSIVHSLLAGNHDDFEVGVFDNFRTKSAQSWRDGVIAAGKNAALECDLDEARKIVASLESNVCNGGITNSPFVPHAKSEVCVIWKEGEAYCRALIDRLVIDEHGCADIWDFKCTNDISDAAIERSVSKYGYHIQEAFYRRGLAAVIRAPQISWTFAFVLNVEPYTVRRVCLSAEYLGLGRVEVSKAIRLWWKCTAANEWPDGSAETLRLDPKPWQFGDDISDSISAA